MRYGSLTIVLSFSSRLPELCDSLNRKLGGPPILVSPKTKQSKPKAPSKQPRPGAVTKRPVPTKNPRSLQRAFSTDQAQRDRRSMSRGPSKAVAALLSATEMAIPGLKKEGGESQSLMGIPRMKSDCGLLRSARPGSLSRSSSMAGDDPRQRKQEMVDAELQDAISALRRPNRQLAGAAIAEAAERRTSGSLSQTRSKMAPHPILERSGMWMLTMCCRSEETRSPVPVRPRPGQGHASAQPVPRPRRGTVPGPHRLAPLARRRRGAALVQPLRHTLHGPEAELQGRPPGHRVPRIRRHRVHARAAGG